MKIWLVSKWRKRATQAEQKLFELQHCSSERAIGEAQGYIRAMRECAEQLENYTSRKNKRAT